jgi:hypothetical protein
MNKLGKAASIALLLLLVATSLIVVKPAFAQSIPKPSTPDFTVKFVDRSYDVPSTSVTTTDPYTGEKKVTTQTGYHIQNTSFVVSIRNQPFASYATGDHQVSLYYGIQVKGHFSPYWGDLTFYYDDHPYFGATNEGYTTVVFGLSGNNGTYDPESGRSGYMGADFIGGSYGGQVDFRAISIAGYYISVQDPPNPFNIRHPYHDEFITLQTSDWSNTQTVTLSGSVSTSTTNPTAPTIFTSSPTVTISQSPTLTPNQTGDNSAVLHFDFNWLELGVFAALGVVVALLVGFIVLLRRRIRVLELKQNGS